MIKYRLYGKLNKNNIKAYFDTICLATYKELKLCENLVFDVNIVDSKTIKYINKTYRHKDKVTDVISFANRDNKDIYVPLLGEIYICLDQAKKQAKEYGYSLKRELCFLFTHGLLHLLGFDHINPKDEKQMMNLTKKILNKSEITSK